MDREYLEEYRQAEHNQYERFRKRILEGKFDFERDRYPPDRRFVNIKRPVAVTTLETAHVNNVWAQVPFCGSLILPLLPWPRHDFERSLFKISETHKIIDFIKDTGKIQLVLTYDPVAYEGMDYLDPFFEELKPPQFLGAPLSILGNKKEIQRTIDAFYAIAKVRYLDWLKKILYAHPLMYSKVLQDCSSDYAYLKLMNYTVVEEIENLMIDDPQKALSLFTVCRMFIVDPAMMFCYDTANLTIEDIRESKILPPFYQPREIRFPFEIGKFLLEKLTYAPQGFRACIDIIDHYSNYDLQKILESLNDAILTNHPDIVNISTEELSEILDNVWNDQTIPRRIKGLKIGIPLSMATIGSIAAGPIGAAGGFLAGLGFDVLSKSFDVGTEKLSERLAKLRTKSYQANIYNFKKKYIGKLPSHTQKI